MERLGIDIGGSGVKGAPVDLRRGVLTSERFRIPTPQPSTPEAVADVVAEVVEHFGWHGPVGCTVPGVVKDGCVLTAANLDPEWNGTDARSLLEERTGRRMAVLNDADAAGAAEMAFGAGKGRDGVVLIVTFGTGIGTALFVDGMLVPNTELGHVELDGSDAERMASDRVRETDDLSWKKWAKRVERYLLHLEGLLAPDLVVIGGGVSKPERAERFLPRIDLRAEVVPAALQNAAGIVGAALAARSLRARRSR